MGPTYKSLALTAGIFALFWAVPANSQPMSLYVDAGDAPRRLFHIELTIPVSAGKLTLVYPRWAIPTDEAPRTTLNNVVGLRVEAAGRRIEWARDPVDMFAFHVEVPKGVDTLAVSMNVIPPAERTDMNAATGQILTVDWQTVILYPRGAAVADVQVRPRLRLPPGWQGGSSMPSTVTADGIIEYPLTSLARLVDSPVLAGKYFSTTRIAGASGPPTFVHIAADNAAAANLPAAWETRIGRIVNEAGALFGGYPYGEYHFLIALTDGIGNDGLEHRESSDIRVALAALSAEANRLAYGYLIPHEYIHAWNGKFTIPKGLVRRDFQQTQTTELLWVYEGLTRYLNWVLGARAGVFDYEEARDYAALLAAKVAHRPGRQWRSLQDTALSASMLNAAPDEWESLRRSVDYYDEGLFIWLEVDTTIRRLTDGRRSLDDFCRAFFGPARKPPAFRPYVFDDVIKALNSIAAHDWRRLLRARLDATGGADEAPFAGLAASGWGLRYDNAAGSVQAARDTVRHTVEERFSIGMLAREDGDVVDVIDQSAAWQAGIGPGMTITAVNGEAWSPEFFRLAIARDAERPLTLTIRNGAESFVAHVEDAGGARYPHLVRAAGNDVLAEILRPGQRRPTQ